MRVLLGFGIVATVLSCAPSRFIKPLNHKQHAISASLGGALMDVPGITTIPMPNTSLGYGYGVMPEMTVYGNWYTTAAIFGDIQLDAGCSYRVWKNNKMGVTVNPSVNFMVDVFEKNARLWPQLDANYYVDYWTRSDGNKTTNQKTNFLYAGFSNWFELQSSRAHQQEQPVRLLFNPQIGHTFQRGKWDFNLEVKFLTPYVSNKNIVIDYFSPFGNFGGMGTYFGLTYKL
ncbi:MAG: hypothetical protein ACK47F_03215 [Flavobacteriales bacterium]